MQPFSSSDIKLLLHMNNVCSHFAVWNLMLPLPRIKPDTGLGVAVEVWLWKPQLICFPLSIGSVLQGFDLLPIYLNVSMKKQTSGAALSGNRTVTDRRDIPW